MRLTAGVRAATLRGGAGLLVAALLAVAARPTPGVETTRLGADSAARPAGEIEAIPLAVDTDGDPIPPAVGEPPAVDPVDPGADLLAAAQRAAQRTPPPGKAHPDEPDPGLPVPDEDSLLVHVADGASDATIQAALEEAGVAGRRIADSERFVVDTTGHDNTAVTAALTDLPGVAGVEPNLLRHAARVPNDAERPAQQPYLDTVGLPTAWDVTDTAASVTVAVLDTGVDLDHPDLVPNLVPGRDIVNNDAQPADDDGHGTRTAGIIGAATNNGVGVAGVAWNAKIMPVKVLDAQGNGTDADVAAGIHWAVDHGAKVINLSLGGPGASPALEAAVTYALGRDVVVVAAAGNEATQVPSYPAATPGVLGVSATDHAGQFAWFSNHGPWVMLSAPGIDVHTTALAPGPVAATDDGTGTSFSSPIVAGVAALLLERHPGWTWDTVAWQLIRTSRDAGPAGVDDAYGYGIVDAAAALGATAVAPVAQPDLAGDAGDFPAGARVIAAGAPATEALGHEYDEDWFAVDVPATSGVTVTVTPPAAAPASATRAREVDPILDVYGPGGGLVATVDSTFEGEPEVLETNLGPGRIRLRVRNYLGSGSPSPYSVAVQLGAPLSTFAPVTEEMAVTSWEWGAAVADVTGDGRDDAVMSTAYYFDEENDYKLFALPQEADGTLGGPLGYATHLTYPARSGLVTGDFDGDGDTDVAVGTAGGLDVAWQGAGGLTDTVGYDAGGEVVWIAAAQIDGSGPVELVATGTGTLRILRWTGAGFVVDPGPATSEQTVAAGDVDGDGRVDIVTAGGRDQLSIHRQGDSGSWGPPEVVDLGAPDNADGVAAVTVGDISQDGRDDIVVSLAGLVQDRVYHLIQGADGSLGPIQTFATFGSGPVKTADVTGDGRNDIVVFENGSSIAVHRQTATGTIAPAGNRLGIGYNTRSAPDGFGIGDLDGDGLNDIAAAGYNTGLSVIRHTMAAAAPETTPPWFASSAPAPHASGVAGTVRPAVTFGRNPSPSSVNRDTVCLLHGRGGGCVPGTPSLSGRTLTFTPTRALEPGTPNQLLVWGVRDSAGNPVFATFPFMTAPAATRTLPVNGNYWPFRVDLEGDGYDDVVWYAPGTGTDPVWLFGPNGKADSSTNVQGSYVALPGDFDGNGYEDVLWYAPGTGADVMWANGPAGIVSRRFTVNGTYVPVTGDFDRNGYDDVFWYGPGAATESLWKFRAGGYTSVAQPAMNVAGYRLAAGDFNRDGFEDIFWHLPGVGAESLWKGGPTSFARGATTNVNGSHNLRAGDFTGDGFDDLYWWTTGGASLWRGSAGSFTSQPAPVVPSTARPVTGEFTGDGRDDLITYVPGPGADHLVPGKPTGL